MHVQLHYMDISTFFFLVLRAYKTDANTTYLHHARACVSSRYALEFIGDPKVSQNTGTCFPTECALVVLYSLNQISRRWCQV